MRQATGRHTSAAQDNVELRDALRLIDEKLGALVDVVGKPEAASFSLKEFLRRHDLSESQYHRLRREGRGPRIMRTGSTGVRISREAERDWILERERDANGR